MPTDVGGLNPLAVSLRDYVDEKQQQRDKAVSGHSERHHQEQTAHQHVHALEKEAVDKLAALVAAQRGEDAHNVEVALVAVQNAAQIHAVAHEQQHHAHQAIHDVEKEAIVKATEQMDKRLYAMNEYRSQLREQSSTFMSRELGDAQLNDLRTRVAALTSRLDTQSGQNQGQNLERRLDAIRTQVDSNNAAILTTGGQAKGVSATLGYLIAAVTLIISVASVVIALALR